jgi:hypothetical protein
MTQDAIASISDDVAASEDAEFSLDERNIPAIAAMAPFKPNTIKVVLLMLMPAS